MRPIKFVTVLVIIVIVVCMVINETKIKPVVEFCESKGFNKYVTNERDASGNLYVKCCSGSYLSEDRTEIKDICKLYHIGDVE